VAREPIRNLLFDHVEYKTDETRLGTWRRFLYPTGELFEEFTSHGRLFGLPLLHYTRGRCPETGKRVVAKGVIAIGRLAVGILAIGHASIGVIGIGQATIGLLFGLGQASAGLFALGQLAVAGVVGVGQVATGLVAIGQGAIGVYVLAQFGLGEYVWDMHRKSTVAAEFFRPLIEWFFP
jgi:hypothetical protein